MADKAEGRTEVLTIAIDGEKFTMADLTFRERKEVRRLARELDGDPDLDMEDVLFDSLVASFACVVKQRTDDGFTIDDAMDLTIKDLAAADAEADGDAKPRPTQRRKAAAK